MAHLGGEPPSAIDSLAEQPLVDAPLPEGPLAEPPPEEDQFLSRARSVVEDVFGFPSFREGQLRVLHAISSGEDVVVIMPTGSGKSLCYQIPAIVLPGVTLVVSPLIALMKDQVDGLELRGVPVTFINSSLSTEEQWQRLTGLREGRYKLVYVAPERFRNRSFRRALESVRVSLLAVDEAHCISQWGHDFRPDYRRLQEVRESLGGVQVVALTATATPQVRDDIIRELGIAAPTIVVTGFDRPNLNYRVERARGEAHKLDRLLNAVTRLVERRDGDSLPAGIVYTATRKHAEEVAAFLDAQSWHDVHGVTAGDGSLGDGSGPRIRPYHAGLDLHERRDVQEAFMGGRLPWVAATNAFGMGVDKADIRFVIHFDLPGSVEAYYQEVGRAGRDGRPSECRLLFCEGDRFLQEFFIDGSNPSRKTIEEVDAFLWSLAENPIFRGLAELHERFLAANPLGERISGMAFRSSIAILERSRVLERLDHYDNLAEVRPVAGKSFFEENPYRERSTVRRRLWEGLRGVFARTEDEAASIRLEHWASELELSVESLKRGLHQLVLDGWIYYVPPFRGRAIRLPEEHRPLSESAIDFDALRKRRQRDEKRLADLISLARSRECRRNQILRYFGDSVTSGECGHCDTCDGDRRARGDGRRGADHRACDEDGAAVSSIRTVKRPLGDDERTVVRKILSGVARARGRCGIGRIVQMLVGSRAKPVRDLGLDTLSTYGILRELKRDIVRDLLDDLEAAGCVQGDGDRYPVIRLTDLGRRVMRDEERIELPFPDLAKLVKPAASARDTCAPVSEEDGELFQRLRELRRQIAAARNVPAYRVFPDRTLDAMARLRPRNREELLEVPGVGQVTLELFGEQFLGEIQRQG